MKIKTISDYRTVDDIKCDDYIRGGKSKTIRKVTYISKDGQWFYFFYSFIDLKDKKAIENKLGFFDKRIRRSSFWNWVKRGK